MRRLVIGLIGGALVVTACADPDATSSDPTPAPVTEAPAAEPETAPEPAAAPTESTEAPPESTVAPEPAPEPEPDVAEPPAEPEPTTTLAPEPAAAPLGGRDLGLELRPESANGNNPMPDLPVDDVRRETRVNLANVFPADLPVLVWAWAPH